MREAGRERFAAGARAGRAVMREVEREPWARETCAWVWSGRGAQVAAISGAGSPIVIVRWISSVRRPSAIGFLTPGSTATS